MLEDGNGNYLAEPSYLYEIKDLTLDDIYPVGSIYMSTDSTSPATRFSGTAWEQMKDVLLHKDGSSGQYDDVYLWRRTA